jgi:TPP-dependent pyruvate/acetoin dehydrogenase alpha subunit
MIESSESKELFKKMLQLRYFEEMVRAKYKNGTMRTPVHLGIGQEAVAVGVVSARESLDAVFTHHRSHNAYLACGGDMRALFAELQGKKTGCSGGKGGSVHLVDKKANFQGSSAILSQIIAIATGIAFGNRYLNSRNVAIVFFGDAGFEEGTTWESFNFAAIHKLPILYVCENNFYSTESDTKSRAPSNTSFISKAKSFGIGAHQVDGNNVIEIKKVSSNLIHLARTEGPQLLECLTYRWLEHVGPYTDLEQKRSYRTEEEVRAWVDKCPIKKIENNLKAEYQFSPEDCNNIRQEIQDQVMNAWDLSLDDPYPDDKDLFTNIFAKI